MAETCPSKRSPAGQHVEGRVSSWNLDSEAHGSVTLFIEGPHTLQGFNALMPKIGSPATLILHSGAPTEER